MVRPPERALVAGFAAAAVAWLVLLLVAPYLVSHAQAGSVAFDLGGLVYLVGHSLCHQRAARSFHAWGVQLPVCARCFGLYASAMAGAVFALARAVFGGRACLGPDSTVPRTSWRSPLIVAAVPTAISVGLELVEIWTQTSAIRAIAALPLGFTVAWFLAVHLTDLIPSTGHGCVREGKL